MLVNIGYLKVGSVCIGNSPFNIVCIRFCAAYCTGLLLGRRMLHKFNVSRMAWSLPCLFWRWTRQDLQWTQNLWRHEGKNSLNNFNFHDDKLYDGPGPVETAASGWAGGWEHNVSDPVETMPGVTQDITFYTAGLKDTPATFSQQEASPVCSDDIWSEVGHFARLKFFQFQVIFTQIHWHFENQLTDKKAPLPVTK